MRADIQLQQSNDIYAFSIVIAEILMRRRAYSSSNYSAAGVFITLFACTNRLFAEIIKHVMDGVQLRPSVDRELLQQHDVKHNNAWESSFKRTFL